MQIKSQELNNKLSSQEKENEDKIIKLTKEIKEIQVLLDDYKKKQESINQNILREKALRDRETFYKIEVSEKDRSDIKGLVNLAYDFNRREVIYKLIYDCFLKKPTLEMCKRVLDGGRPSGIYRVIYR